jgi:urea carboxylase
MKCSSLKRLFNPLLALLLAAQVSLSQAEPLKIGYSDWPGWVAWEVAIEKGMFKDAGVDVSFEWFDDQIRFYPVTESELLHIRSDFPLGRYPLRTESTSLRLSSYKDFLETNAESIGQFRQTQQHAFALERKHWEDNGLAVYSSGQEATTERVTLNDSTTETAVVAQLPGSVWKIQVSEGDLIEQGQTVMVLESMKMEFYVTAQTNGRVSRLLCREGEQVRQGQDLIVVDTAIQGNY